jgi:hypothetical protein|tara:strand:+ start:291 stop:719 length:429 start_codon:yes stop_codon:yes gene_type:complete
MTLEELQEQVDKDLKINDTELDLESLKTPQLHNKYLKHYNNFKLLLTRAESDYKILKRVKWEYYTGKASPDVYKQKPFNLKIMKSDIDKYLESDEELIKAKQKIDYLETVVNYLDRTLKIIGGRDWQIRNSIEWRKFTSGAI